MTVDAMDDCWFVAARERMVKEQLEGRDIVDPRVLEAMRRVPRHRFVPPDQAVEAYEDRPLPIGLRQTISQPLMVAVLLQSLKLEGTEHVLEVGTGSGYEAALLAELAASVVTIERHAALAESARERLATLGYDRVEVVVGDGSQGYPSRAPYDRILVAAAAPCVPDPLLAQLASNGRMVLPVGERGLQTLTVVTKDADGKASIHEDGECVFVPLLGAHGWRAGD